MSYDNWLSKPYEVDNDPPKDEPLGCIICGCGSRIVDGRYCGESCAMADEQELGDLIDDEENK